MATQIYLAIDSPDLNTVSNTIDRSWRHIDGVKIGPVFLLNNSVKNIVQLTSIYYDTPNVFVDLKMSETPTTVVKTLCQLGEIDANFILSVNVDSKFLPSLIDAVHIYKPDNVELAGFFSLTSNATFDLDGFACARYSSRECCSYFISPAAYMALPEVYKYIVPGIYLDTPTTNQKLVSAPEEARRASIVIAGRAFLKEKEFDVDISKLKELKGRLA